MTTLWLTYAWANNDDGQIDHVIAALQATGLTVHFDRAQLIPGRRLWEQLDEHIRSPTATDAWAIYATQESLDSGPCREELATALNRALSTRSTPFPMIGIFPAPIDPLLVPSAILSRIYVNLSNPNWAQLVKDGAEGRAPSVDPATAPLPFHLQRHREAGSNRIIIEVRPRSGRWYPCAIMVPTAERSKLEMVVFGPSGGPPAASMTSTAQLEGTDLSGVRLDHAVDPLHSAYAYFNAEPSRLAFGQPPNLYAIPR